jgi:hypothetical protein
MDKYEVVADIGKGKTLGLNINLLLGSFGKV